MNILVVDDHPLTCQGLAALLVATQDGAQVRSAHSAAQARAALLEQPIPDWIFLDVHLPDDPHHHFFHHLCATPLIGRTVLISAESSYPLISTALAAGARGFIPKTAEPAVVLHGFATVLAGNFFLPPDMAHALNERPSELQANESARQLSPRLQQVQELLLRGVPNKVIASNLNISTHTVKEYVSSVLAFHGVANRLDLVLKLTGSRHPPHAGV